MIEAAPLLEKTIAPAADHGSELKRGAVTNTLALLASNFRGIFTFLVARLLGPAVLGTFSVAWATTDLLTKMGMFALDNSITTFIAHAEAAGNRARARALFRLVVVMALVQCTALALVAIVALRILGPVFGLDPHMNGAITLMICAMPGVALYRISIAVSRGMKVMAHDIYSRGVTETVGTTLAFLIALKLGATNYAPQLGAIVGTAASGLLALVLAGQLFRGVAVVEPFSRRAEAKQLLSFSAPIAAYDLLNSFIVRIDVIVLGCFIGRAPGVTLPVVGIYGAVVEVAGGLRKVNQIFNPIFAPVVAGMTREGKQNDAAGAFARVAQWMLWVLLPLAGVMLLAAPLVLSIYGPAFRAGSLWLGIVAIACGTNAFVGLAETVIMVQKPHLNLLNSIICCVIALIGNVFLIRRFGATGAAFGILLPYILFGLLRYQTLRRSFGWSMPRNIHPPVVTAALAAVPAILCRLLLSGIVAQLVSSLLFLLICLAGWQIYRVRAGGSIMSKRPPHL